MKKLIFAGLAAGILAAGAPAAQAHPDHHYVGGCGFNQVGNDEDGWQGEIHVAVVATNAATGAPSGAPISVACRVYVNNEPPGTVYLTASGTGAAANSAPYNTQELSTDVVTVCTEVTVGGEYHEDCGDAEVTPIIPQPVIDAINFVIDTLNNEVFSKLDPALCAVLAAAAPGGGPIFIDSTGDTYVDGDLWWDCPPYETA